MTEGLTVPDAEDVEKGVKALASAKDSDKPQSEGPTPQSTRPSTAVPVSETPVSLPSSVDMSNLSADDTFDVVFVNDLPNGLQCGLCEQVLRAPVKLPCAHKFCRGCVESMNVCPMCGAEFDPTTLKQDKETHRRIQQLEVKCSFWDNGCEWHGSHTLNCDFADVICSRGCGEIYAKKDEAKHLGELCSKRTLPCEHCAKEITFKGVKFHLKVCPSMLINCPNMCGLENRPRGEIQEHLPTCPKAGSGCPFAEFGCDYKGGREHLQQHIKEQPVKHLSYLCDGVLDLKQLLGHVQLNMEKMDRNMNTLQTRISSLEKLYGAQFIWRVDDVKAKQNEAQGGTRTTVFSAPFLSGRHGYKLILSMSLWGDGPVRGKYISVYISIMKGEFDSLLPWPFVHKVTFTLMDQNPVLDEREHMVYVVKPSSEAANRPYLARPIGERNASFGAQAFLPLEDLDKYVKDNKMFLKCNVDTEHMIML
ncbi:Protein TRF-1 [Aphelenchoides avenae]|nr:Protein TRF-1 [Aphelenchus avenae]